MQQPLCSEDSEAVNNSLLLIRNLLHAPERPNPIANFGAEAPKEENGLRNSGFQTRYFGSNLHSQGFTADCSQQNLLLWNLFAQGLDRILMDMLTCSQKVHSTGNLKKMNPETFNYWLDVAKSTKTAHHYELKFLFCFPDNGIITRLDLFLQKMHLRGSLKWPRIFGKVGKIEHQQTGVGRDYALNWT